MSMQSEYFEYLNDHYDNIITASNLNSDVYNNLNSDVYDININNDVVNYDNDAQSELDDNVFEDERDGYKAKYHDVYDADGSSCTSSIEDSLVYLFNSDVEFTHEVRRVKLYNADAKRSSLSREYTQDEVENGQKVNDDIEKRYNVSETSAVERNNEDSLENIDEIFSCSDYSEAFMEVPDLAYFVGIYLVISFIMRVTKIWRE